MGTYLKPVNVWRYFAGYHAISTETLWPQIVPQSFMIEQSQFDLERGQGYLGQFSIRPNKNICMFPISNLLLNFIALFFIG